jgi:hypothetical protein
MLLRLKREWTGDEEDDIRDEPLPEPSGLSTGEDVGPEGPGEENDGDEARSLLPRLPGPLIAAATFVPTFLALFVSLSYLLSDATQTPLTAGAPVPSGTAIMSDLGAQGTPPGLENAMPPAAVEPSTPTLPLTLPPAQPPTQPPVAIAPEPEPRAAPSAAEPPRAAPSAEPRRQPQAAVQTTLPERTPAEAPRPSGREAGREAVPRPTGRDWTPAAAFADRQAAGRLAASIQQQGYPVEIREEQSSARPWVVWIGAQPRGGERRR